MVHKETCFAKLKVGKGISQKEQTSVPMINIFSYTILLFHWLLIEMLMEDEAIISNIIYQSLCFLVKTYANMFLFLFIPPLKRVNFLDVSVLRMVVLACITKDSIRYQLVCFLPRCMSSSNSA